MAKRKARSKPAQKKKAATKRAAPKKAAPKKKAAKKPAAKKKAPKKKAAKKKAAPRSKVKKKPAKKAPLKKKKQPARKKPAAKKAPARKKLAPRKSPGRPVAKKPPTARKPPIQKKRPPRSTAVAVPKLPIPRPAPAPPAGSTQLQLPSTFLDADHLPLWFGGYGLSECFSKLKVATVGDLRTKSEEEIRELCGTRDLVRLKARIEHFEEKVFASELEPVIEDSLWPASENFAYFLKGGNVSEAGDEHASSKHVCEIIHRPDSQSVTVRLGVRMRDHWQDVTMPLDRLELVSRQHRREELEQLPPLELASLVSAYRLQLANDDDRVANVLHFEFSEFGKSW